MLSVIAVLGVLFFCLNVLFDVSLFRFAVLRAAARRFWFCGLDVLSFWYKWSFWCAPFCFVLRAEVRSLLVLRFCCLGVLTCFGQMINFMYLVLGFDICLDFFFFWWSHCLFFPLVRNIADRQARHPADLKIAFVVRQDRRLSGCGRKNRGRLSVLFWQTRFSRGGHFEPTAKVCVKFAWLVLRFRLPQAYANAIRRVRRICLTE